MKKFLSVLIIVIALLDNSNANAQHTRLSIKGSVASDGKPVENATVELYAKGAAIAATALTDSLGNFIFKDLTTGTYHIKASQAGMTNASTDLVAVTGSGVHLQPIELQPVNSLLSTVIVQSKKAAIEMKADKMILNVDASPSNAGSTAMEVLEKAPGVQVDKDGNISLKGKEGVMILIDGKPSYLDGSDLANMLKGMPSSQLDQIEVMTNPPARYDAAGNAGVINIKTKKIKTRGFNGNVTTNYAQGVYPKTGLSSNINLRRDKFNLFANAGYSYRGGFQKFEVYRNIFETGTGNILNSFEQHAFMPETRKSYNGKLGIDYDFSAKTTASVSISTFNTNMTYNNNISSKIYDRYGELESSNTGNTYMMPHVTNYSANANLQHKFDSLGTELTFDAAYINFRDDHRQFFHNMFYDKYGTITGTPDTLHGHLPTGYNVYAFKADFTKPFKNKSQFEAGIKGSYVSSDNDIRFDSIVNGSKVKDINRTNHYKYEEKIYAGYINYSFPLSEKLKVQTGVRYEYTDGQGISLTTNSRFNNKYGQLFPTLFLSYDLNDNHQFSTSYGKRVSRPQYKDMNPFVFIIDRYTFVQGNPHLQPQFSHNIEVKHMFRKSLTTTLNYSETNGVIAEVLSTNSATKEATLVKKNIASRQQYGIAINYYKPVTKWLTIVANSNVYNNRYQGIVNDSSIDYRATSGNFYGALQFKLGKGWDSEINGWYNTRGIDGISYDEAMGMFSIAGSKSILQKKGKVSLNVRDPFQMLKFSGHTKTGPVDAQIMSRWDNRAVTLTFNYRFGKQFKTNKRVDGSASEEQGRIGG